LDQAAKIQTPLKRIEVDKKSRARQTEGSVKLGLTHLFDPKEVIKYDNILIQTLPSGSPKRKNMI
jgi:hypothetical protein